MARKNNRRSKKPIKQVAASSPGQVKATKTAPKVPAELLKDTDIENVKSDETTDVEIAVRISETRSTDEQATSNEPLEDSASTAERTSDDQTVDVDDPATDAAVNEVAADEADTMLALQDAANEPLSSPKKHFGLVFWILLFLALAAVAAVPTARQTVSDFVTETYHSIKPN
jgi:hypothetical protein